MGDDQPVVLLVTYMGSTSMFHDISPEANGAASNNLALLLSAHLISSALDDGALDALHGRIAFGAVEAANFAARTGTHSPRHPPTATTPHA